MDNSDVLPEVSTHFRTLNNGTLEIRTTSGVYLIAMKIKARRDYRNDISDVIGILFEEKSKGKNISYEDIKNTYNRLYNEAIPNELAEIVQEFCKMESEELDSFYHKQIQSEQEIGGRVISYIEDGANINARNVEDVIARIKEKMEH